MPIYLVRWPDRTASLVRAHDEPHLESLLDEVGDPSSAIWEEYDGPLWLDFEPHLRATDDGLLELDDEWYTAEAGPMELFGPRIPGADTGSDMCRAIVARVFPHVYAALSELDDNTPNEQAKARIVAAFEREQWLAEANEARPRTQTDPAELELYMAALAGEVTIKRDRAAELEDLEQLLASARADAEWRAAQYARLCALRQFALADLGPVDDFADDLADEDLADDDDGDVN